MSAIHFPPRLPEGALTRKQLAALLGVSEQTVFNLEREGRIQRRKLPTGQVYFERAECEELRRTWLKRAWGPGRPKKDTKGREAREGALAAKAFAAFAEGKTPWDVVVSAKITPERAAELWDLWRTSPDVVAFRQREAKKLEAINRWSRESQREEIARLRAHGVRAPLFSRTGKPPEPPRDTKEAKG